MAWDDDSWKDGYDEWKLRSPYDDEPEEECYHEEHDSDWEGRATCSRCGYSWWLSAAEIEAERERSEAYDAHCRRELRRDRIKGWMYRLAFWRRWQNRRAPVDDEIPF